MVLTAHQDDDFVFASFHAGAEGYILKDSTYAELLMAMKNILRGKRYVDSAISETVLEGYLNGRNGSAPPTLFGFPNPT